MWEWRTIMTVDHTKWHALRFKDVSVQGLTRCSFCKAPPSHPGRSWQRWGSNPSAWCTWSSVRSEHRSQYKALSTYAKTTEVNVMQLVKDTWTFQPKIWTGNKRLITFWRVNYWNWTASFMLLNEKLISSPSTSDIPCSVCCFCAWHWYFWYRSQYGYIKSEETEDIFSSANFAIIHILKTELHNIHRPSAKVCHDSAAAQRTAPGDWWDWSDLCSSREWELCKKSERKCFFSKQIFKSENLPSWWSLQLMHTHMLTQLYAI